MRNRFVMRALTVVTLLLGLCDGALYAQRVTWNVTGTTEGLWNISQGKTGWCNLLEAGLGVGLWDNGALEVAAISTYSLNTPVADDLQAFSCIDAGADKAFRLTQAGISHDFGGRLLLFGGLRNIDMDHFTTPFTALFTNASHGNFPILSANFPLATYPLSALCLHLEYRLWQGFVLRESVYNGVASDKLDRQFRFCPQSDGVFNIGSLAYHLGDEEHHRGHYTLGYALGTSPDEEDGGGLTYNYALWTLVEQPFIHFGNHHLSAMLQGGTSPATRSACRWYGGAGLIFEQFGDKPWKAGAVVNRALYADGRETDVELTGSFSLCSFLTLQPAVHFITTTGHYTTAAQLRLIVEFGN